MLSWFWCCQSGLVYGSGERPGTSETVPSPGPFPGCSLVSKVCVCEFFVLPGVDPETVPLVPVHKGLGPFFVFPVVSISDDTNDCGERVQVAGVCGGKSLSRGTRNETSCWEVPEGLRTMILTVAPGFSW